MLGEHRQHLSKPLEPQDSDAPADEENLPRRNREKFHKVLAGQKRVSQDFALK
jgi:hypothetical protein